MTVYRAPKEWTECVEYLAAALDGRSRWRLPLLMLGAVFAGGRRTVTSPGLFEVSPVTRTVAPAKSFIVRISLLVLAEQAPGWFCGQAWPSGQNVRQVAPRLWPPCCVRSAAAGAWSGRR